MKQQQEKHKKVESDYEDDFHKLNCFLSLRQMSLYQRFRTLFHTKVLDQKIKLCFMKREKTFLWLNIVTNRIVNNLSNNFLNEPLSIYQMILSLHGLPKYFNNLPNGMIDKTFLITAWNWYRFRFPFQHH